MIVLRDADDRMILSFIWTKRRNVTDGQTARGYYSGLHSEQCGRAIKILPTSQYLVVFRGTVNHKEISYR